MAGRFEFCLRRLQVNLINNEQPAICAQCHYPGNWHTATSRFRDVRSEGGRECSRSLFEICAWKCEVDCAIRLAGQGHSSAGQGSQRPRNFEIAKGPIDTRCTTSGNSYGRVSMSLSFEDVSFEVIELYFGAGSDEFGASLAHC